MKTSRVAASVAASILLFGGCSIDSDDPAGSTALPTTTATSQPLIAATTAVGKSPTTFSVAANGSAKYSIPLWTPPGVGEVEPKLALEYDSNAGNGPFGMGWGLAGSSAINRCPQTVATNNTALAVALTSADRFCLDGQPLQLTGGVYGASGSTYATENETFSKVAALGVQGNGPATFTVTSKNGLIYTYGGNGGTMPVAVVAGTTLQSWHLSQIADRVGNKVTFTYNVGLPTMGLFQGAQTTPLLTSIAYPTTATGQGPFYQVVLNYEGRLLTDHPTGYSAGVLASLKYRVASIQVKNNGGTLIKAYNLTYTAGAVSKRATLTAVQECGATTCLAPTTISYALGASGFDTASISTPYSGPGVASAGCGVYPGDYNNDGKTDILWAPDPVFVPSQNVSVCNWSVRFSTGTAFTADVPLTGLATDSLQPPRVGTFKGNSRTQLMMSVGSPVGASGLLYVVEYNAGTNSFVATNTNLSGSRPSGTSMYFDQAADYDGDGRTDLLWATPGIQGVTSSTVNLYVTLNTTTPGGAVMFGLPQQLATLPFTNERFIADGIRDFEFNHDSAADLMVTTEIDTPNGSGGYNVSYNYYFLRSNGAAAGTIRPVTLLNVTPTLTYLSEPYGTAALPRKTVYLTDWNGDGCTDYVFGSSLAYSNCLDAFVPLTTLPEAITPARSPFFFDYDGDGRTDLVYRSATATTANYSMLRSIGNGFESPISSQLLAATNCVRQMFFSDFDGDGLTDLASYCRVGLNAIPNFPTVYRHASGAAGEPRADVAKTFTDGFGLSQTVTYGSLAKTSNYFKGSSAVYPEQDIQSPMYVATQVTASNGIGGNYTMTYWYAGARISLTGRGFEGFTQRSMQDSRTSVVTTETFATAFPHTGKTIGRLQQLASVNLSNWVATPAVQTLGTGTETRKFSFFAAEDRYSYEAGGTKNGALIALEHTATTYGDTYGNPTQVTVTTTDYDSTAPASPNYGASWTATTTTAYLNNTTTWCLGLPTTVQATRTAPGQPSLTRTRVVTPDATYCRIATIVDEPTTAPSYSPARLMTTTQLGYDGCGNLSSATVTGHSSWGGLLAARTQSANYGTRCQLPESQTNALNQTRTTSYNYNFGVATGAVDENLLSTTWVPDEYGRITRENSPDGTYTVNSYSSTACSITPNFKYGVLTDRFTATNAVISSQSECFDGMERTLVRGSIHPRSTVYSYDETRTYDALGRVARRYRPYTPGVTVSNGYELFTYDVFNRMRIRQLYQSNGTLFSTLSVDLQGMTTKVTDRRGYLTTIVSDVMGNQRSITEPAPGGTTTYAYDAMGRRNAITDATGKTSTVTYNILGAKVGMVDADRGTSTFDVDSLGETTSVLDQKGQGFYLAYDALGRMTSRVENEGTSTWTWGNSAAAHNIGSLAAMSNGNGQFETLTYDALARPAARTITIDQPYTYNYTYNNQGFVDTVTYPTSAGPGFVDGRLVVKYNYHRGELVQLQDATGAGKNLWTLNTVNDYNSPTLQTVGDIFPVAVTKTYVPHTNRLATVKAGVSGSLLNRQNTAYGWDANGNLLSRQDVLNVATEGFVNDSLNRLQSSTLNGAAYQTFTYGPSGNILTRSDVGSYAYADVAHPHAATSAGANTYTYDGNGNMATKNGVAQTWASFDLPLVLAANGRTTTFSYDANHQVYFQSATYAAGIENTYFIGEGLQRVQPAGGGFEEWRHSIPTPGGVNIVIVRKYDGSQTYNVIEDQLGSTTTVINDSTGLTAVGESFGPFGNRRAATGWNGAPTVANLDTLAHITRAGFTGHTQLDNVGFIHMRGRTYDPDSGRFMSVDPLVGDSPQALNPYSYVSNRPLSEIDPTGMDGEDLSMDEAVNSFSAIYYTTTTTYSGDNGAGGPSTVTITGHKHTTTNITNSPTLSYLADWYWGYLIGTNTPAGGVRFQERSVLDKGGNNRSQGFEDGKRYGPLVPIAQMAGTGVAGSLAKLPSAIFSISKYGPRTLFVEGKIVLGGAESRTLVFESKAHVSGSRLVLEDLSLFPTESRARSIEEKMLGRDDMRFIKDEFGEFAKKEGYAEVEVSYKRMGKADGGSTAQGGRTFHYWIDLATGKRTNLPQ